MRVYCASLIALFLLSATILPQGRAPQSVRPPYVADYRSEPRVPETLLDAYVKFVEESRKGEARNLQSLILPQSVEIVTTPRVEATREFGTDINLPFLRSGFDPKLVTARRDADDAWLLRTATTAVWFVQTKSGVWRIYRYVDKPIQ